MSKMSDLMNAFDDVQNGTGTTMKPSENKFLKAQDTYLQMIGESRTTPRPQQAPKENLTEASKIAKMTAALQVIRETADTYDNPIDAFAKIEKIVNACK